MKRKISLQKLFLLLFLVFFLESQPVFAESFASLVSDNITITSPQKTLSYSGPDFHLTVSGTAKYETVWLCVRGPGGEIETYRADIKNEQGFSLQIRLRFGPGKYTFWVGNNSSDFDGLIKFEVISEIAEDLRCLAPSAFIDYETPAVKKLAEALTGNISDSYQKLKVIHKWVTNSISYDVKTYHDNKNIIIPASEILRKKSGLCREYAFITAALCRASGIPARVVYGQAGSYKNNLLQNHAWNETFVNGKWVVVDTAWDAGYMKNGEFIYSPATTFFDPAPSLFAKTHNPKVITNH